MTWIELGLAINVLTSALVALSVPMLVAAVVRDLEPLRRAALGGFVAAGFLAGASALAGAAARHVAAKSAGGTEVVTHLHRQSSAVTLAILISLAAVALAGLILSHDSRPVASWFIAASLVLALPALLWSASTAEIGARAARQGVSAPFPAGASVPTQAKLERSHRPGPR